MQQQIVYSENGDHYQCNDTLISRISLPTPFPVGPVNVYLIRQNDRTTLFDTGPNEEEASQLLQDGLDLFGVDCIHNIVLSHNHFDHSGLTNKLVEQYGSRVFLHPEAKDYVSTDGADIKRQVFSEIFQGAGFPKETVDFIDHVFAGYQVYGCKVDPKHLTYVGEGNNEDLGGNVIHCPGHSEDLIALDIGSILLCGDVFWKDKTPNPFFSRGNENRGLKAFLETYKKMYDREVGLVLPGHGSHIENHRDYIDFVSQHHEHRVRQVIESLSEGQEKSAYEIIHDLFEERIENGESIADAYFLGLAEVLGHTELLIEQNVVSARKHKGVILYKLKSP
ncbi:MBL fold metallo-hydrolase [Nanoarchaeota archaeon]